MATTGRKPYFATSYHDMMRHIYAKPKGHSEGRKPYMEDNYFDTEYPQLKKYNGGGESLIIGTEHPCPPSCGWTLVGGTGGDVWKCVCPGDPPDPGVPSEPLPNTVQLSCLQQNSLCYCIICESLGSQINIPCNEPMDPDCQTLICENPADPCPPFMLTGNEAQAVAPVTLCPSTPICAASISGGTPSGSCVYVPDTGCGTKTVSVTDICGNTVSTEVRMSSGAWFLQGHVVNDTNYRSCSGAGHAVYTDFCEIIDVVSNIKTRYEWYSTGTQFYYGAGICPNIYYTCGVASSMSNNPCTGAAFDPPPVCGRYPAINTLYSNYYILLDTYTYVWCCPGGC